MKLINKATVVAEIERRKKEAESNCGGYKSYDEHRCDTCIVGFYEEFLEILDTLEVKDVDLNKEIEEYLSIYWPNEKDLHPFLGHVAKHFFELGLSHSIDESIIRRIIDLYFEASKHYDEVIKQERNENGGSQLAIDILDGSKDMKGLCVQYILEQLKAQKVEEI